VVADSEFPYGRVHGGPAATAPLGEALEGAKAEAVGDSVDEVVVVDREGCNGAEGWGARRFDGSSCCRFSQAFMSSMMETVRRTLVLKFVSSFSMRSVSS
jgi:hypothetical protein